MTDTTGQDSGATTWSGYWASGQQHSLFANGKPVATAGYWARFFDGLPEGSVVLDLACGAGALTRHAVSHSGRFTVIGADYASGLATIDGARIDPNVRLETLPYPPACFTAAISQFGIEYSQVGESLAEVARVLVQHGRFAFLCHASEGISVTSARQSVAQLAALLAPDGLIARVESYGRDLAAATSAPPDPAAVAEAFRSVSTGPMDEATSWALSFLGEVMTNALKYEPAYVLNNAASVRAELTGQRERLVLMVAAARDAAGIADLVEQAKSKGLQAGPALKVIDVGGGQIGWWLEGFRAA